MHERNSEYMPIMDAKSAVAIDFDVSNGTVYYSDVTEQKIFKFNLGHLQNDPEELPAPVSHRLSPPFTNHPLPNSVCLLIVLLFCWHGTLTYIIVFLLRSRGKLVKSLLSCLFTLQWPL